VIKIVDIWGLAHTFKGMQRRMREVGCDACNLKATLECDTMSCSSYIKHGERRDKMGVSKAERMREREMKIERFKLEHYNQHDAELLADAEIALEDERAGRKTKETTK
jgi:hypothetical protein